jgi:hypothetical protein
MRRIRANLEEHTQHIDVDIQDVQNQDVDDNMVFLIDK